MTHQTKDCLERPRAKGAKFTNKNIAADDKIEEINITSFDAKRDRWNGYDAKDYAKVGAHVPLNLGLVFWVHHGLCAQLGVLVAVACPARK